MVTGPYSHPSVPREAEATPPKAYGFFIGKKNFLTKIRGRVAEQAKTIDVYYRNSSQRINK